MAENIYYNMIENYMYLLHTDTYIAIPVYPESITDSMPVQFSNSTPLMRSAPIYSYNSSGPRSLSITLKLHRDLMNEVNQSNTSIKPDEGDDYTDLLIKQIQSATVPKYSPSDKMVSPPVVALRFGSQIFCKGVINSTLGVTYSMPIVKTKSGDKYAVVTIDFIIFEIDPYDASTISKEGSFRGLSKTLERRIESSRGY